MQELKESDIIGDFEFPTEWLLFGPVKREAPEPDFATLKQLPNELVIAGQRLTAQEISSRDSRSHNSELDLGASLGGRKEGKTAYLITAITVEREMEVTLCASADWWMKWWLNGCPIYDTLGNGNEGNPGSLTHSFKVRLRAGSNLFAVKVISGTGGFTLKTGGPRELREYLRGSKLVVSKVMEDAPLLLLAPRIRKFDEPEHLPERNDFTMSSGIDRTLKGRLWVSWFGGEDGQKAFLMMASSDDDGMTWSKPRYTIKEPLTPNGFIRSILGGNLWTDPQGRLWCFFAYSIGYCDGRAGVWTSVCDNPDSEALDWSTPKRLFHGFVLNKPIILRSGEWVLPTTMWDRVSMGFRDGDLNRTGLFRELDQWRMTNFLVSIDKGATWERRGGVFTPEREFDEPVLIEKKNGELRCLIRTHYGIAETRSFDHGFNWSKPEPSKLQHCSARIFTLRLKSGKVLLVKHGPLFQKTGRSHLTAYLSDDEGETWDGGLILDEREEVSYPDGFQAPDGRIYVAYDRKRIDGEILLAVFAEEDMAAGKPVSKTCRLKIPVMRTEAMMKGQK
jgi:hypothetical protein